MSWRQEERATIKRKRRMQRSIRRNLKLDESCISNPKVEILNWTYRPEMPVQFKISTFGFEMQDSSNFTLFPYDSTSLTPLACNPFRNSAVFVRSNSGSAVSMHRKNP